MWIGGREAKGPDPPLRERKIVLGYWRRKKEREKLHFCEHWGGFLSQLSKSEATYTHSSVLQKQFSVSDRLHRLQWFYKVLWPRGVITILIHVSTLCGAQAMARSPNEAFLRTYPLVKQQMAVLMFVVTIRQGWFLEYGMIITGTISALACSSDIFKMCLKLFELLYFSVKMTAKIEMKENI